jgi:anti-sigma factor RsiW
MTEMVCNELVDVITDYLEGTLPEADRRRFEKHLEECSFCVTYVEQMRATVARLGTGAAPELPEEAREDVLAAFKDWRAADPRSARPGP